jgi:uncharacterized protein YprB with RNaseH-like and TPR domain
MRLRDKLERLAAPSGLARLSSARDEAELRAHAVLESHVEREAFAGTDIEPRRAAPRAEVNRWQPAFDTHQDRIARLRSLIAGVSERDGSGVQRGVRRRGPLPLPVGELRDTAHGPVHLIETYLPPTHCHGRVEVRRALAVQAQLVSTLALDPRLGDVDFTRMLLLDTETTGLSGGTGTVPFLIGLAFFEDGALKVEQLFLRELGQEKPMLAYLAERLSQASCIVSYNGKAFDWPLLRTRSILSRVPLREPPAHLDLLHCARRILKGRLDSVRLAEVERAMLGHYREDDVAGALIPSLYLEYLRGGDVEPLRAVVEHNASDLIGLAAILPRLVEHFAEVRREDDPHDHLAFAKVALRAKDFARAESFARAAAEYTDHDALACEAHGVLASSSRKRGDARAAIAALHAALERSRTAEQAAALHCALSKLYERGAKDPLKAYAHARHTLEAEGPDAHGRRLGRLHRRLLKTR